MCRLFGMSGGSRRVHATFWLLEAPDSLAQQSRRDPDGTGIGTYDDHDRPRVSKQPLAAYQDTEFAREAREVCSRTFVAHVRYASNGGLTPENTHPFEMDGRLFAHNGVIGDVPALEAEVGSEWMGKVQGQTDSERFFALISREAERTGDLGEAIARAARRISETLPVFALNLVLIDAHELWALRYPDTHTLYVLERDPGGPSGGRHLDHASARGSIRVRSGDLAGLPAVVVASEQMDEDPHWSEIEPGELVHVSGDLRVERRKVIDRPPAQQLTLQDLDPKAAASQGETRSTS